MVRKSKQSWHKHAVIYQIYPRSFKDASGDGIGDLKGIIEKLDYLGGKPDSLGVDAIWISPVCKSPMADFGYDVSDYTDIDPLFGNLNDMKELLHEAHARGIKIMMDFVPNHSSDQHKWFLESASSRDNLKRDWYVWRDPAPDGSPPNNWLGVFGGSAWEFSSITGQYYLHSFLVEQPDLNWDNPEVRQAMTDAMRFWLDLGVDGFRVDAIDFLAKDPKHRDEPINPHALDEPDRLKYYVLDHPYSREWNHLYDILNEMADVLGEYKHRFMVTEGHPTDHDRVFGYVKHYKNVNPTLAAPFNFEGIFMPWEAAKFKHFVDRFQSVMKRNYTPSYSLGNHDETRLATRIGPDAARTAAVMLLTLPGQAFVYYGDELGMTDTKILPSQIRDPAAVHDASRDPERTPMLWDSGTNAGFSEKEPWLPVSLDYKEKNVINQLADPDSSLNLYKQLIALRKNHPALTSTKYKPLDCGDGIFGFIRPSFKESLLVLLNFSDQHRSMHRGKYKGSIELSTISKNTGQRFDTTRLLAPHEGLVIRLD
jgi:alpha-glucosidase